MLIEKNNFEKWWIFWRIWSIGDGCQIFFPDLFTQNSMQKIWSNLTFAYFMSCVESWNHQHIVIIVDLLWRRDSLSPPFTYDLWLWPGVCSQSAASNRGKFEGVCFRIPLGHWNPQRLIPNGCIKCSAPMVFFVFGTNVLQVIFFLRKKKSMEKENFPKLIQRWGKVIEELPRRWKCRRRVRGLRWTINI